LHFNKKISAAAPRSLFLLAKSKSNLQTTKGPLWYAPHSYMRIRPSGRLKKGFLIYLAATSTKVDVCLRARASRCFFFSYYLRTLARGQRIIIHQLFSLSEGTPKQ
jgi:hypothetical protein